VVSAAARLHSFEISDGGSEILGTSGNFCCGGWRRLQFFRKIGGDGGSADRLTPLAEGVGGEPADGWPLRTMVLFWYS